MWLSHMLWLFLVLAGGDAGAASAVVVVIVVLLLLLLCFCCVDLVSLDLSVFSYFVSIHKEPLSFNTWNHCFGKSLSVHDY